MYLNIGSGIDITIKDLTHKIVEIVGYKESVKFDTSMPDGTLQKLLDISEIKSLGWKPKIILDDGLVKTYNWFITNVVQIKDTLNFLS